MVNLRDKRIGEERMMSCGEVAKIIDYKNYNNVCLRFADGTIRSGVSYKAFILGSVAKEKRCKDGESHLGEERVMNCGESARIIAYRGYYDIDVQFADSTVRTNVVYPNFLDGSIAKVEHKVCSTEDYIGKRAKMNCGEYATIIEYLRHDNITVMFDDGTCRRSTSAQFNRGSISKRPRDRGASARAVGERQKMNCGNFATVVECIGDGKVKIRFENDGTERCVTYDRFKRGKVSNVKLESRVGLVNTMKCGLRCKIVEYVNAHNMAVVFDDGEKKSSCYDSFLKGAISHPYFNYRVQFAYLVDDIAYYTLEYNNERYLGTLDELKGIVK